MENEISVEYWDRNPMENEISAEYWDRNSIEYEISVEYGDRNSIEYEIPVEYATKASIKRGERKCRNTKVSSATPNCMWVAWKKCKEDKNCLKNPKYGA